MVNHKTLPEKIFHTINIVLLGILALISLLPLLNVLAVSFSSAHAAASGSVSIFPVEFNTRAYEFVMSNDVFWSSFLVSLKRVAIGVPINLLLIMLTAYPLSRSSKEFKGRTIFAWFFMFSMLFSGGLIPLYLTVQKTGLLDSFWSLILPCAVPVYYVVIMLNFFRQIPNELIEAAKIDGAGEWTILFQVMLPLSKPAIATVTLLCFIFHWNSWFDGLLYIGSQMNQPLQSYLQSMLARSLDVASLARNPEQWKLVQFVNERTVKCAQIFIATIPIMVVYPWLQKYFTKGIMVGAVKE